MINIKQLNNFINECKNIGKSHDVTIIGSKDSIEELSGFIINAKFEVAEGNELPQSNMIYIIPKRKDKPVQMKFGDKVYDSRRY